MFVSDNRVEQLPMILVRSGGQCGFGGIDGVSGNALGGQRHWFQHGDVAITTTNQDVADSGGAQYLWMAKNTCRFQKYLIR